MSGSAGAMVRVALRQVGMVLVMRAVRVAMLRMGALEMRILIGQYGLGYSKQLICGGRGIGRKW